MRTIFALVLALALPSLSGCLSDTPMGMFRLEVKDSETGMTFESLTMSVDRIVLTMVDGMRMEEKVENVSFDLVALHGGVTFTVYDGHMMAGDYKRVDIYLGDGQGVLEGGVPVTVSAPNGRVYVTKDFSIPENGMAEFVFDIQVEDLGGGQYRFAASGGEPMESEMKM